MAFFYLSRCTAWTVTSFLDALTLPVVALQPHTVRLTRRKRVGASLLEGNAATWGAVSPKATDTAGFNFGFTPPGVLTDLLGEECASLVYV